MSSRFTFFSTDTAFSQRIVAQCMVTLVLWELLKIGPKLVQSTLKKRNVFWGLMLLAWTSIAVLTFLQWVSNYHVMVVLKGASFLGGTFFLDLSICVFFFFYFGYALLSSLRFYRFTVVVHSGRLKILAHAMLACHCIWVTFVTLYLTTSTANWYKIRSMLPGHLELFLVTPFYFRIITFLGDSLFLWVIKSSSMRYKSIGIGMSRFEEVVYILLPNIFNLLWFILYLVGQDKAAVASGAILDTSTISFYIGPSTLAVEMISFSRYTNHVMELLFTSKTSSHANSSVGPHDSKRSSHTASNMNSHA